VPTAMISVADSNLTIGETTTVTISFSEAVSGFGLANLTASNGVLSNLVQSATDPTVYTATLTPTASIENVNNAISLATTYTDVAGNTGTAAMSNNYAVDTAAPAAPVVVLAHDTTNGADNSDGITRNGSLSLSGIEAGAAIEYTTDGGATWSSSFTAAEGANSVQVRQTDVAGNISSSSATLTFTLDTLAPAAPTVSLTHDTANGADNSDLITNNAALNVSTAAADVTRTYTVDGGVASSSYSAPTADGSHTVLVTDSDAAGNQSSASLSFTLDTTIATPTAALASDSGTVGDLITNNAALNFSTVAADVTRTYTVDGGIPGSSYSAPTGDGPHTVTVTDIDAAGNTAS